jgi:predicted nucleic acid-binding protein
MSQSDRALELYEVLLKGQDEPATPPEVIEELRRWQAERDREWRERMKAEESDSE